MCALAMIGIATQAQTEDAAYYDVNNTPATRLESGKMYMLQNCQYGEKGISFDSKTHTVSTFSVTGLLGKCIQNQGCFFTATADGIVLNTRLKNINDVIDMDYGNAGGGQVLAKPRKEVINFSFTPVTIKDLDGQYVMMHESENEEYNIYGVNAASPANAAKWYAYEVTEHTTHTWDGDVCTLCGIHAPISESPIIPTQPEGSGTQSDPYLISNRAELYWFATKVNGGDKNCSAKLTADIIFNDGTFNADGTWSKAGEPESWAPLSMFNGTFDGNGHTISGLYYCNAETNNVGFCGELYGAIKHLGIINSYLKGNLWCGIICGSIIDGGTISDCYTCGSTVIGDSWVGCLCGRIILGSTISNCYTTSKASGNSLVGNVCGQNIRSTLTNCYTNQEVSNDIGTHKDDSEFKSGEVTYLLTGGKNDGYQVWFQTLGEDGDAFPTFVSNGNNTVQKSDDGTSYINVAIHVHSLTKVEAEPATESAHGHNEYWACSGCDAIFTDETGTVPANLEEMVIHSVAYENGIGTCNVCHACQYEEPTADIDGCYLIGNAGQLIAFANWVNNGQEANNAKLTANIILNDGTFADDGTFNATGASASSTPIEWPVIGRYNMSPHGYAGTFDGQGHTISGLYANYSNSGLVGMSAEECKIKNVGVINSYFAGIRVGGICGIANDNTEISNCYSINVICKGHYVGGIIGQSNSNSTSVKNCYSTASLINQSGNDNQTGGIAGQISGSTTNCYTSYEYVNGWSGSEINCEANVSLEHFASGEIAYKLNGSVDGEGKWTAGATDGTQKWYQKLGENGDSYPVLAAAEGNTVYEQKIFNCGEVLLETKYYNTEEEDLIPNHDFTKGKCTVCGYECEHDWEEYGEFVHECTICFHQADHDWGNGDSKCAVCGYECQHKVEDDEVWENGKCTICGKVCQHDWESDDFGHGCTICDIDDVDHDWSNEDGKCSVCGYECQHSWEYGECTICDYECKHKDSNEDDNCDICGIHAQTFASLAALIAADQDYDAVNVTIDDEILIALPHPGSDFSGMYAVILKSDVQLVAPIPEPALNWKSGGRIKGTLKYADWGKIDNLLISKDADFWLGLEYTAPAPVDLIAYNSIDELLAAGLENGTPVTVTINGTIAETFYEDEMYQIVLDNGFALGALAVATDPEWKVGGTISGTLEDVTFMKNDEAEEEAVGIVSLNRNIFAELNYSAPIVYVGKDNNNVTYAEINGTSNATLNIASDRDVDYVVINRSVTSKVPASMMMPFDIAADDLVNGTAYTFAGVYKDESKGWTVEMVSVKSGENILAYQPFVFIPSMDDAGLKIDAPTTIKATTPENNKDINKDRGNGTWSMKGAYEYKQWNAGDPELGTIYGVAGQSQGTINAGDWVKAGAGASILPMRTYIKKETTAADAKGRHAAPGADETPRILKAKFIDGEVTGIGTLNSETGEFSFEGWYDLNGRKIEKPTKSGIYINGNKKVMIK